MADETVLQIRSELTPEKIQMFMSALSYQHAGNHLHDVVSFFLLRTRKIIEYRSDPLGNFIYIEDAEFLIKRHLIYQSIAT
jgi:hypothetical protein